MAKSIYTGQTPCHTVTEVYDVYMVSGALVSTVLMGVLVVAVFGAASRLGAQRTAVAADDERDSYTVATEKASALVRHPAVWAITFLALALGAGAITVAAVGGLGVPEDLAASMFGALLGLVAVMLAGFLFLGPYFLIRSRGLGNAQGIVGGILVVGLGFLLLVSAQLVARII